MLYREKVLWSGRCGAILEASGGEVVPVKVRVDGGVHAVVVRSLLCLGGELELVGGVDVVVFHAGVVEGCVHEGGGVVEGVFLVVAGPGL